MSLIQKLKNKYLQMEQKVKQRTHAIDLLVSGQTAANQRSIANRDNIKILRKDLQFLVSNMFDTNIDNRHKFRYINGELLGLKRTVAWLKAWLFGLTIFTIVMMVFMAIQMF